MVPWWLQVLYRPVPISNAKQEGKGKGKQARATREQPQQQQSSVPEAVDGPPAKPVKLLRKANSSSAPQEGGISSAPTLQAERASQVGCTLGCVTRSAQHDSRAWQRRGAPRAPKLQAEAASQVAVVPAAWLMSLETIATHHWTTVGVFLVVPPVQTEPRHVRWAPGVLAASIRRGAGLGQRSRQSWGCLLRCAVGWRAGPGGQPAAGDGNTCSPVPALHQQHANCLRTSNELSAPAASVRTGFKPTAPVRCALG